MGHQTKSYKLATIPDKNKRKRITSNEIISILLTVITVLFVNELSQVTYNKSNKASPVEPTAE